MEIANHRVENWAGSIVSYPRKLVRPLSVSRIQQVVADPATYPSPVRAAGSNHSTTECAVADGGTLLEMAGLAEIRIDRKALTVTAGAGALYVDVAEALAREGLQLYVNPEIGNVSVGSACCGGTKDASMRGGLPQVSSYCIRMKIVTPGGALETIEDEERLSIMRSSYGLLGIVYEATFRVKERRPLRFSHEVMRIEEFAADFERIRADDRSMMLYVLPFIDRVVIEFREEVEDRPLDPRDRWKWKLRNWVWKTGAPAFGRICSAVVPFRRLRYGLVDTFNRAVVWVLANVLAGRASDPKDQVIRYPDRGGIGTYTFSIWAFPEARFPQILRDYVRFCRDYHERHGYRCNMLNVGYRFAEDPGSILSYSYDGPRWSLDVVSTGDAGWDRFVWSYNRFCSENEGKPLFNQTRSITPEQVRRAFGPLLDRFEAARRSADPQGRFLNCYFAWLLSPAQDAMRPDPPPSGATHQELARRRELSEGVLRDGGEAERLEQLVR